ncbi:putative portal protein [Brucella phage V_19]|uniref:Putative portal protein n=20 Tax=root TaxID=1 RepID=H2EI49_9CAUD|nr:portal protein [Brucella phage Tb]YP_007002078.1 portal protein [Brucella phage Pr]AHB81072.1 putative portal protein [Brucella phage Bk]AHB81128.1 putative portal protein [Brucella phage Fz]AHB81186.1 putative portal protein [Brucella phage R/C]AHB81242.1 putative portal protein [Brucella phage S708]AHB81356.1 putative portal protein [Brucella phage Wb]AKO59174.1 putative portal protein [Brucella phage 11sa_141]AKO59579.1 putative portal protein [Brucella phage 281_19]AKO59637.1 putati
MDEEEIQPSDTLELKDEPKSSSVVLSVLQNAKDKFREWQNICDRIDTVYSKYQGEKRPYSENWTDGELDLFWASYEILKPAVYAHPPKPVVSTQFKDRDPVKSKTAELLERVSVSNFDRSNIDDVMCEVRDDLIFTNRGVMWLTYESEKGEQRVCIEHLDRMDFLHEPARKWSEVGWVARRAWMTRKELRKRFYKASGDVYKDVKLSKKREDEERGNDDKSLKGSVWEVWHRADNKVYWVSEGVDRLLDEGEPHLKLKDFFPCPRPAYGTLARRSLIPVPDYERYSVHFDKINTLTARIYLLLEKVKLKGIVAGSGDIRDAVSELIQSEDDETVIFVPSISSDVTNMVAWMPLAEVATAITGLIEARAKLIDDFYQLSGISDIMRGATEADETLGAQQLKGQYGSVRVRQKIDELQRIAADAVRISAEIIAEHFSKDTLLEMSQMKISTKAQIEKQIKGIEEAAEKELENLKKQTEKFVQENQIPPELQQDIQTKFKETQQAILQKYAPMLQEANSEIPIEDIIDLLRNDKSRGFAFEIASDSTILTDEIQEKASRNEFLTTFSGASQALQGLAQMGPAGSALAGGMLNFVLGPYRIGRELDGLIDNFIDEASNYQPPQEGGEQQALIEAQNKLAEAEMAKAQAQMAKVQADAQLKQAELQGKMQDLQLKAQKDAAQFEIEQGKLQLQLSKQEQEFAAKMADMEAKTNLMQAQTAEILAKIGLDVRKQDLEEYKAANEAEQRTVDTALRVESENRANRSQEFNETQALTQREVE